MVASVAPTFSVSARPAGRVTLILRGVRYRFIAQFFWLGALICADGCSIFKDFDALSARGRDASAALSTDASLPVLDASIDGPPPEKGRWCDSEAAHLVCTDFDREPFLGNWFVIEEAAVVRTDAAQFTSSPFSMTALVPYIAAGTGARACLRRPFSTSAPTSLVELAFDVLLDDMANASDPRNIAQIELSTQTSVYRLNLSTLDDGTALVEEDQNQSTFVRHSLTGGLPLGRWARVDFRLDMATTPTTSVTIDGASKLDRQTISPSVSLPVDGTVSVGQTYIRGPAGPTKLHIDNLLVDAKPSPGRP